MAVLKRENILEINDIQIETVSVPEWGGEVCVRGMSGAERDRFETSIVEIHGKRQQVNLSNVRAKLACFCICDEDGQRLFTEKDINDLAQKSAAALQHIFEVAQRLSGIGETDIKELADGLKNAPSDGSISD